MRYCHHISAESLHLGCSACCHRCCALSGQFHSHVKSTEVPTPDKTEVLTFLVASTCFSSILVSLIHPYRHIRKHPTVVVVLNILLEMMDFFCSHLHISDILSLLGQNMKRNPVPLMLWTQLYYSSPRYKQDCTRNATWCINDAWNGRTPRRTHSGCLGGCLNNVWQPSCWDILTYTF